MTSNWKETINGLGVMRSMVANMFMSAASDQTAIEQIAKAMYAEENFGGAPWAGLPIVDKTMWARRARGALSGIVAIIKG